MPGILAGEGKFVDLNKTKHRVGSYLVVDNKLFHWKNEIKNVDVGSVNYIDDQYIADKYHAYLVDRFDKVKIIPDADGLTFNSFGYGFYQDKYNIYYNMSKTIKN